MSAIDREVLDWLEWKGILEDVNPLDDDEKAAAEEAMRRREVALNRTIVENCIVGLIMKAAD